GARPARSRSCSPCRKRRRPSGHVLASLDLFPSTGLARALADHGLDARDVAPHLPHARGVLELPARLLKAQVEHFLAQLLELALQLVVGLGPHVARLHGSPPSPTRATTRVATDSFAEASAKASRAIGPGTPSSSNMIRPGFTRQTQNSGVPLPLPMRTSAGLRDTGTSGKMRIQTRPTRLMWRVMARRAASISRAVTRPGSVALRPKLPKLSAVPPLALPWMRPLCALRYLVRAGWNIDESPSYARAGCASAARLSWAIGSCCITSPLNTQTFTPQVP